MTNSTTERDPDRFRNLERLFALLLSTDPSRWDEVVADRAVDPRLAREARRLLTLDRSGAPDRYLRHLVTTARAVLRGDRRGADESAPTGPTKPG